VDHPEITGINHIGITTGDLDRAVRIWSDKYGIGPWTIYAYDGSNMTATVDGKPVDFRIRVGLCQIAAAFRIEIIQPLDGNGPYAESLARHGGADHIQHVRLDVADHSRAHAYFGRRVGTRLDARFKGKFGDPVVSATYLATDDLGFLIEIAHRPNDFEMPDPEKTYP
jgi:catechol 2,3-dioxygenase-like lactoylglutathione lyase family enzyme